MEFKVIDLFKYYLKNLMLALIVLALSLISGYYYLFNIYETEYIANTTIMLGANNGITDIGFNQKVIKNYLELVKSKNVLESTINKTQLNYSNSQLKGMINASFAEDTEFITITVISKNKEDAAKLSYAVYEGLELEVERIFKINNIHLVDTDTVGHVKYSDKLLLLVVLFISILLSFFATTINYLFFPNFNLQEKVIKLRKKIKEKKALKKIDKQVEKLDVVNKKRVNKTDTTKKNVKKSVSKKTTTKSQQPSKRTTGKKKVN